MSRKEFSREVAERVLIRSRRHCCVCEKFCGTKIELHHILGHDDNSEENALPVCFDCHAEITHYNDAHPKGRKYLPSELKSLRETIYRKYSEERTTILESTVKSEYGRGFHEGASLSEKRINSQLSWNYISRHGDFAIEVLVMFGDDDNCSMMNEMLYDDRVDTGASISQRQGHDRAWEAGLNLGLWNVDPDKEILFLTKRGQFFRATIHSSPYLRRRYRDLQEFWRIPYEKRAKTKPGARPAELDYAPGWFGWLQAELYSPVMLTGRSEMFVLASVEEKEVIVNSIDSPLSLRFSPTRVRLLELDKELGVLRISIDE